MKVFSVSSDVVMNITILNIYVVNYSRWVQTITHFVYKQPNFILN